MGHGHGRCGGMHMGPGRWGDRHGGHGGWGREHGGGRGRRRMFDGGELRLVLLKLIADDARPGYDLNREIEDLTGGAYAPHPGIVYPPLNLPGDMGLCEEQAAERTEERRGGKED